MLKTIYPFILLIFYLGIFTSCKQENGKKAYSLQDYMQSRTKSIKYTKPIDTAVARQCVDSFFWAIKPHNPQMKCYIEIDNLQNLVDALKNVEATGIRIYSAGYNPVATEEARNAGMNVSLNDFHLILVPIKNGEDELIYNNTSVVYNFNNDCPQYCNNIEKAKLIWDGHRDSCR